MAGVYGFVSEVHLADADPAVSGERFNFVNCGVVCNEEMAYNAENLRGTRSQAKEVARAGIRRVGGPLNLQPTAVEMAKLLPWILGAAASGTTYALADTLPAKYVFVVRDDGTDGKFFAYNGCKVDRAVFHATRGGPLMLDLDVVGIDETVSNAGSKATLSLDITSKPYMFFDLALVVNSVTINCESIEIAIDNKIDKDRFYNSQTLTMVNPTDRVITVKTRVPYGDAEALYNAGPNGVTATATFSASTSGPSAVVSLLFTFAALMFPRRSPLNQGKGEFLLPIEGEAKTSGSTKELVVTCDTTP